MNWRRLLDEKRNVFKMTKTSPVVLNHLHSTHQPFSSQNTDLHSIYCVLLVCKLCTAGQELWSGLFFSDPRQGRTYTKGVRWKGRQGNAAKRHTPNHEYALICSISFPYKSRKSEEDQSSFQPSSTLYSLPASRAGGQVLIPPSWGGRTVWEAASVSRRRSRRRSGEEEKWSHPQAGFRLGEMESPRGEHPSSTVIRGFVSRWAVTPAFFQREA